MRHINLQLILILCLIAGAAYLLWTKPITLGLDLQGGSRLVLQCQNTEKVTVDENAVHGVVRVIRDRIDKLGVAEPTIQRKGTDQVIVELPGIKDPDRAIRLIGETAVLEFVEAERVTVREEALTPEAVHELYGQEARLGYVTEIINGKRQNVSPIILKQTVLTGNNLKGASVDFDQFTNPVVAIEFDNTGSRIFGDVTSRNVGKPIAILLDNTVISAPNVNEPILGGRAQISGNFTIDKVKDLVIQLNAGALPVPVKIIENKNIGATLGKDSLEKSKIAGVIGFAIVLLFMLGYYRLPGFFADIALILYVPLVLSILALAGATLTLPGIAGFILSIGMAVDANIIVFERLKEELQKGKALRSAVDTSFKRAFNAIVDANVTTLIAAAVLFQLGTGSIRGFALTLSIGITLSMFTSLVITRVFLEMMVASRRVQSSSPLLLK